MKYLETIKRLQYLDEVNNNFYNQISGIYKILSKLRDIFKFWIKMKIYEIILRQTRVIFASTKFFEFAPKIVFLMFLETNITKCQETLLLN